MSKTSKTLFLILVVPAMSLTVAASTYCDAHLMGLKSGPNDEEYLYKGKTYFVQDYVFRICQISEYGLTYVVTAGIIGTLILTIGSIKSNKAKNQR